MLTRLRLRVGLVSGDEQKRGVHDGRTGQHRSHERIVTRAIHEGDMPRENELSLAYLAVGHVGMI